MGLTTLMDSTPDGRTFLNEAQPVTLTLSGKIRDGL